MEEKDYLFEIAKLAFEFCNVYKSDERKELELFRDIDFYIAYEIPEELWKKLDDSIGS